MLVEDGSTCATFMASINLHGTKAKIPFCNNHIWVFRDSLLEISQHRFDSSLVLLNVSISAFQPLAAEAPLCKKYVVWLHVIGFFGYA